VIVIAIARIHESHIQHKIMIQDVTNGNLDVTQRCEEGEEELEDVFAGIHEEQVRVHPELETRRPSLYQTVSHYFGNIDGVEFHLLLFDVWCLFVKEVKYVRVVSLF